MRGRSLLRGSVGAGVIVAFLCGVGSDGLWPGVIDAIAQTTDAAKSNVTPFQFIIQTVWYFLFGLLAIWILVLRPEQLRNENTVKFLKELKKGDRVVTSGGIIGRVVLIKDDEIQIEIAQGVKVKVLPKNLQALSEKVSEAEKKG